MVFLRFPQGSPIVHSFCTRGKCFLVAGQKVLSQSGCSETWNPQSLPDDDCGDAGGSWQFSRVNCWGKLETRASANRLPGHCGLLYSLLFGAGWAAGQRRGCREAILRIAFLQASTGKCGTPRERCRTSTVVPPLLAAGRQESRSTSDAAPVAGRRRICFWKALLPRIRAGLC